MLKYCTVITAVIYFFIGQAAHAGNWNVPRTARALINPIPVNEQTIARGKQIFNIKCARCHGVDGSGNGTEQKVEYALRNVLLIPTGPDSPPLTDGELYWKLTHGVGRMPAFAGILNDTERWTIVNYLRTFTGEVALSDK